MKIARLLVIALFFIDLVSAQVPLGLAIMQEDSLDQNISTPQAVSGHKLGAWHYRPDQIVRYFEILGEQSDRCLFQVYGKTHEGRRLVTLTISSPENLARLEEIRKNRLGLYTPEIEKPQTKNMPVVLWMGYSVHGDESSGANAAIHYAYRLAAAKGQTIETWLKNSIVILDPCLNPDGLGRFAHWANMHKGQIAVADANHREHRQPWPSGRTNHYWFDLNRDWLLAQHPESQARLKIFHAWRPNIVTDFHEMGTGSTYFFQPGVKSRHNPLIPAKNYQLTAKIGEYHAETLNKKSALYYTREQYDDFYFGKGSTYPDAQGAIGILFEQASSRGHVQENRYGKLTFKETIENQLRTSFSTHAAAVQMREELLNYQRDFVESTLDTAQADSTKAWVFASFDSSQRAQDLVELFLRHQIKVHVLAENIEHGGKTYVAGRDFIVHGLQPQYRLLKSMVERRSQFNDAVFYDVSAWNMFAAYGLDYAELDAGVFATKMLGKRVKEASIAKKPEALPAAGEHPYAYVFSTNSMPAARFLMSLLQSKLKVLVSSTDFSIKTSKNSKTKSFKAGAVVIPRRSLTRTHAALNPGFDLQKMAAIAGVELVSAQSGLTPQGPDMGSPSLGSLRAVKPLIVIGGRTSAYEAGEVWHLMDARLKVETSLIDKDRLKRVDLSRYTHILAVSGAEQGLDEIKDELRAWVEKGGVLITQRSAAHWAGEQLLSLKKPKRDKASSVGQKTKVKPRYSDRNKKASERRLSGAIFSARLDITHPLGWGISNADLALWRKGAQVLLPSRTEHNNPLRYTAKPLFSGFASPQVQRNLANTTAASVDALGGGVVVRFADNMNFRAYWRGTERIYLNAILFAQFVAGRGRGNEAQEDEAHGH